MKSNVVIILFLIVSIYITSNTARNWKGHLFTWDKSGYHLYLPAIFIYHDITRLAFYKDIEKEYAPSNDYTDYGLNELENGNRGFKYTMGIAVMESPFFLAAHFLNTAFLNYPADGYSLPYQWGAIISNLCWVILGLFVLKRFLSRYFNDEITAVTLLAIAFGTNIYHYVVFSAGMTHSYSFALFSMVLLLTDGLYIRPATKRFCLLGMVLGLTAITRSTNLVVVLVPILWGLNTKAAVQKRVQFVKEHTGQISVGLLFFLAVMMIQMGYWKYVTGHWLYDGYPDEGFIWTGPEIIKGLFSFQKGWLVYTPMAIFSLWGLYSMRKRFAAYIPAIVIFMSVNIYIIFSWWNWWYGGGFGCRPLVEAMAILSLPLAAFFEQVAGMKKMACGAIVAFLVFLNMFQSYQLFKNTFHWDRMSRAYYFRVFLKSNATARDKELMMTEYDFFIETDQRRKAMKQSKEQ